MHISPGFERTRTAKVFKTIRPSDDMQCKGALQELDIFKKYLTKRKKTPIQKYSRMSHREIRGIIERVSKMCRSRYKRDEMASIKFKDVHNTYNYLFSTYFL